ncbi:hypothetical protein [Methylovulum psychrotolerans]|uniref:Uncharacterized protein n=1 Tax=Methylovulum psychrotolerans TaxID=1704499 RepID=A0A2S5CQF7_9GAMM|nr:hypothetical protein [Methylovulum psychrotolerans]POZ52987.1 hypothetical protein AADEFJLK_01603 [Methylovulum psychrotolerans]
MNKSQLNSVQNSGQTVTQNPTEQLPIRAGEPEGLFINQGPDCFFIVIDRENLRHIRISPEFDTDTEARGFLDRCDVNGAYLVKTNCWA